MPADARSLIETSPMRTPSSVVGSVIVRRVGGDVVVVRAGRALHLLLDQAEQVAIGAAVALAGLELFLARRAHQAAQLLDVGGGVGLDPFLQRVVAAQQLVAPVFG